MNIRQHKFITEYLRFGDKAIAYKNAYNAATANYKTLESAANRLLRNPDIAQALAEAQGRIREQVEKELVEQQKGELLTIQKKRKLLYQVATGEMHVLQYHKGKDCNTCTQYVTPTINHMLRAIHLDSKLAGHYPQKENKKTTLLFLGEPVPPRREDIGANAESIEDNGGGQLAQGCTQQVLSPADRSPVSNTFGGRLKTPMPENHNKTQQNAPSCHAELDSVSGETPKQSVRNKNILVAVGAHETIPPMPGLPSSPSQQVPAVVEDG